MSIGKPVDRQFSVRLEWRRQKNHEAEREDGLRGTATGQVKMNRRRFSQLLVSSIAGLTGATRAQQASENPAWRRGYSGGRPWQGQLFPVDLPVNAWCRFSASGFTKPVAGIIYNRQQAPKNGMPLGAIDTGRIDVQPNGTLGYCTLFNSVVPQRDPLDLPFLGLHVGNQKWLLCQPPGTSGEYMFAGLQTPSEIHYWGHYPVADMEFEMSGSPLDVSLRSWAPFVPGDSKISNTPGAVFDVHLKNSTAQRQSGKLVFSFPGPT